MFVEKSDRLECIYLIFQGKNLVAQFPEVASKMAPTVNEIKTKVQTRARAFRDNVQTILSKVYADLKLQDVVGKQIYNSQKKNLSTKILNQHF